jgi:hypothetical protein
LQDDQGKGDVSLLIFGKGPVVLGVDVTGEVVVEILFLYGV